MKWTYLFSILKFFITDNPISIKRFVNPDIFYKSGLTNLFIEIGLSVIKNFNIETEYIHLDATSFHLQVE